jgi:hypothetical protein
MAELRKYTGILVDNFLDERDLFNSLVSSDQGCVSDPMS